LGKAAVKTTGKPTHLQAHCQSPTSKRYNQNFVKELAKPAQREEFQKFSPSLKKTKTPQHTGDTDRR